MLKGPGVEICCNGEFFKITVAKKKTGQPVLLIPANQKAWSIKNSWPLERSSKNLSNATLLVSVALYV